jgi:hypothetical protein
VVQHDPDFQRFYGVNRKVDEMTWNEIAKLRSTPGNARPLQFHELARLAKNRIQLMIDTKPPEHSAAFYNEMERAMRDNGLLESALFIGTAESRARFKGKARISVTREELLAAMKRGEDCARLYFLFEHGTTLDEAGLSLARKANVPAVVSINIFHYGNGDHRKLARTDIERLRKAGMTYFQIDSVYDAWLDCK